MENTQNNTPPRPADPLTAQDGARLMFSIEAGNKRLESILSEISNRLAGIQAQVVKMAEVLSVLEADTADNRIRRLELEIDEAERDRDIAEKSLAAAEAKLRKKQDIKEVNQSTGERLQAIADSAYEKIEKQKQKTRAERIDTIKWAVIQGVAVTLGIGFAGGVISFIWYLFQLWQSSKP